MIDTLRQDLRYAARMLLRTPTLTAAAIICLALGIGANAAIFGIVDRLFFRAPAHVADAGRVVRLYVRRTSPPFGTYTSGVGSYARFMDLREATVRQHAAFADLAAYHTLRTSLGRGADAEQIQAEVVTASSFRSSVSSPPWDGFSRLPKIASARASMSRFWVTSSGNGGSGGVRPRSEPRSCWARNTTP